MNKIWGKLNSSHWPIFVIGNFNALINLLLPLVLVRIFDPEEMGLYKIFFLYVGLIPFFTMTAGILTSVYYWVGDKVNFPKLSSAIWQLIFTFSLAAVLPIFLILLFLLKDQNLSYLDIALITFSSLLAAPSAIYGEYTMASGRSVRSLILGTSFEVIKVTGFIFIAYQYRDIKFVFYFFSLMMLGSFILMNTLAYQEGAFNFKREKKDWKKALDYSFPISLSAALVMIIEKADQLILATFLSTTDYAFYTLGCLVVPTILILESSIQKKLIPNLSSLYQKQEIQSMQRILKEAIEGIAFLTIPSIFGLILYSDVIIEILYTKEYLEASFFLKVFALNYFMYLIPHDSLLRSTGQTKILLKINIVFATLSLLIILICAYLSTATITLGVSIVLKLGYRAYLLNKSCAITGIHFVSLYASRKILSYMIFSFVLSTACWFGNRFFENQTLAFLINGGLFALIYLLTLKKFLRPAHRI